ncbi:MAG: low molecular weight phosphotyrosine protein phosphatase [Alphaproteobacteria bacterium]|nr:low molecular weight phosphotyrosine protein phosphatase [Alphaproteobacteria bacterium]
MAFRVLFVCTGNICRSPTAAEVFRAAVAKAGLTRQIDIESAGTHGYHIGEEADARSISFAARRGVDLAAHRARKVVPADFTAFDLILALDRGHLQHLRAMRRDEHRAEVRLLLDYHPDQRGRDVPDPYYGGDIDFELVLDLSEDAAEGLLNHVRVKLSA